MKISSFYHKNKKLFWFIFGGLLIVSIYYFQNPSIVIEQTDGGYTGEKLMASYAVDSLSVENSSTFVIKTASLTLHVDDVRKKAEEIKTYTEGSGGYIGDSSISKGDSSYSGSMTLRIPSDKFEGAMSHLQELAVYVVSTYTNANDVTELYSDLDAKIGNRKALEQQYLDILKKATDVDTIASITKALADARSEIETFEIEKKSYDNQINYSTISVYLEEDASPAGASETWNPKTTYKQAVSDWVVFLQAAADKIIYAGIYGWPLLLLYILYRIIRRKK